MIEYKECKEFKSEQISRLFKSVGWVSADYPNKLVKALANSDTVISAWDKENLAGLINVIDDGVLTAYAHYLLVAPSYQGKGIGTELIERLKIRYKDYLYLLLNAEKQSLVDFYEKRGFQVENGVVPMAVMNFNIKD